MHFDASLPPVPDYVPHWNTTCPTEAKAPVPGWIWGGGGGLLKDGVYDYFADSSSILNGDGEFWTKIHLEQVGNP